jgi:hypothetical protein
MSETSTAKGPLQRTKPQLQKKDRLWGAIFAGGKTMLVSFAKTGYALWLEITGLLCALIAVRYGSALLQEYRINHFADRHRSLTFTVFTVVFTWFTILSFVKARRMVSRKRSR